MKEKYYRHSARTAACHVMLSYARRTYKIMLTDQFYFILLSILKHFININIITVKLQENLNRNIWNIYILVDSIRKLISIAGSFWHPITFIVSKSTSMMHVRYALGVRLTLSSATSASTSSRPANSTKSNLSIELRTILR